MKKWVSRILVLLLAAGMLISGAFLIKEYGSDYSEAQKLSSLSNLIVDSSAEVKTEEGEAEPQWAPSEQYVALYEINPDFVGWIEIDGTEVDYPVMHTPEEPEKYLHLDFYGDYSQGGVPFLDGACSTSLEAPTDNWIIYGHNMKSTTMFSSVLNYANKEYCDEHPIIHFDTMERDMCFEVIGAFYSKEFAEGEEGFRYCDFKDANTQDEFDTYVSRVKANALYDTGVGAEYGDQLLTLSTCSFHTENGRFVVVARETILLDII